MRYLSLLLLGPWLIVLAWIYWLVWRRSRLSWSLKVYDSVVVVVALVAAYGLALGAYDGVTVEQVGNFGRQSGSIWKQVMPALYGYGAFAAVMIVGIVGRALLQRSQRKHRAVLAHSDRLPPHR